MQPSIEPLHSPLFVEYFSLKIDLKKPSQFAITLLKIISYITIIFPLLILFLDKQTAPPRILQTQPLEASKSKEKSQTLVTFSVKGTSYSIVETFSNISVVNSSKKAKPLSLIEAVLILIENPGKLTKTSFQKLFEKICLKDRNTACTLLNWKENLQFFPDCLINAFVVEAIKAKLPLDCSIKNECDETLFLHLILSQNKEATQRLIENDDSLLKQYDPNHSFIRLLLINGNQHFAEHLKNSIEKMGISLSSHDLLLFKAITNPKEVVYKDQSPEERRDLRLLANHFDLSAADLFFTTYQEFLKKPQTKPPKEILSFEELIHQEVLSCLWDVTGTKTVRVAIETVQKKGLQTAQLITPDLKESLRLSYPQPPQTVKRNISIKEASDLISFWAKTSWIPPFFLTQDSLQLLPTAEERHLSSTLQKKICDNTSDETTKKWIQRKISSIASQKKLLERTG